MIGTRTYDVAAIRQQLVNLIDNNSIDIVSFDVFDTIIYRSIHADSISVATDKWLEHQLDILGLSRREPSSSARQLAYRSKIEANAAAGLDLDTTLESMSLEWVQQCHGGPFEGDATLASRLVETEAQFETSVCNANAEFSNLLRELKDRNIRIIYISDMYLGKKIIDKILSSCGILKYFDQGYVSGDLGLLKRTGRLFDFVLKSENISASRMIHIGDNEIADGKMPTKVGIKSAVFRNQPMKVRSRRAHFDHKRMLLDRDWAGVVVAQYCQLPEGSVGAPQEAFGHSVLGPIFSTFIHRVVERCVELGISDIYFPSREGFILKSIFDLVKTTVAGANNINGHYLYISRLTALVASTRTFSWRQLSSALSNAPEQTFRSLVAPLNIESSVLESIGARVGVTDLNMRLPPFAHSWPPLQRFLEDAEFCEHVASKADAMRAGLLSHLDELGFFQASRVAFVDVGWAAQIQESLFHIARRREPNHELYGFYLGTRLAAHWRAAPGNHVEWVHADESWLGWSGRSAFEFVQGIETVIRAPHGTTIGYRTEAGEIRPIFRSSDDISRQTEIADEPTLALFQSGIISYASKYTNAVRMLDVSASDLIRYSRTMLNRLVRLPTLDEIEWIGSLSNVSDLGSDKTDRIAGVERPTWLRLRSTLRASFWKYGVVTKAAGRTVCAIVAGLYATRTIPKRIQALDPWIPHRFVPASPRQEIQIVKGKRPPPPRNDLAQTFNERLKLGRRASRVLDLHARTGVISTCDVLLLYVSFKISRLATRLSGRHVPHQDGMSIKGFLRRRIAELAL